MVLNLNTGKTIGYLPLSSPASRVSETFGSD
jgi:hypothetical protein